MDKDAAVTMMEAIPPFDWSEVALKSDIETAIAISDAKMKEFIATSQVKMTKTFVGWMLTGMTILVAAVTAITMFAK